MSEKILLIDGHSILNRAFYGLPDLTNAEGLHTGAVYGFLTMMLRFIEEEKPDYLAVAFDLSAPTFRHEMYGAYKGTRKPMMDELRQQVPVIKEVLTSMTIPVVSKEGLEADDILGTLSRRGMKKGMDVVILSGDRDLLQLATDTVKIRIPKTRQGKTEVEDYLAEDVKMRYQVSPVEFIDMKALMGDASDNIPGVPGIGEKTAAKIISKYHSIENAHDHAEEIKPPRASKALIEHWDLAVLSKTLATICLDGDFPFDFESARLGNIYTKDAFEWCKNLQFKNLLSRFDIEEAPDKAEETFTVISDLKEAEKIFSAAALAQRFSLATGIDEEAVLPLFASEALICGISLTFDAKKTYYIEVNDKISADWILLQAQTLIDSDEQQEKIVFGLKDLMRYFSFREDAVIFDAMIAAYLINPLKSDYEIEDVAREYLNLLLPEKRNAKINLCYESYILFHSKDILLDKLKGMQMETLFSDIEMPLVFVLHEMEKNGIKVFADSLKDYGLKLADRISELEEEIYDLAGESFNINSPKQLGVILFEKLKIKGGKKTKSGYSTAAAVLEKLSADYPIVNLVLEYRQYAKLKSTYADGLAAFIQEDGRIHGKFNQTITATGRISSTEPNLQNIPIRMELGRMIRKVFVPEEGYIFTDADYSQIELRILAHCSGDENLITAYKESQDIHRLTASQVFHVPFEEVTPLQRRNAKAVNFGIVYGISSFGLSEDLSISRKEAASYIESYFNAYPGIKTFLDKTVADAKEKGFVSTLYGRRRPIPELSSGNFMQRQFGERVAMNAPIQGTAADIMKIAMIGVYRRLKKENCKSRLLLQVHDELLIETELSEKETVRQILTEEMEQAACLAVPMLVDVHEGENWYEAK